MYTYEAKNLITVAINKCVLKSLRKQSVFLHVQVRVNSQTKRLELGWKRTESQTGERH